MSRRGGGIAAPLITLLLILLPPASPGVELEPGDVLLSDSDPASAGRVGRVVHVSGATGLQTVVASSVELAGASGVALDLDGTLLVGAPGRVLRVNLRSGLVSLLAEGDFIVGPRMALLLEAPDSLLAAAPWLVRLTLPDGTRAQPLAQPGPFSGLARAADGTLLAAGSRLFRVDLNDFFVTGSHAFAASGEIALAANGDVVLISPSPGGVVRRGSLATGSEIELGRFDTLAPGVAVDADGSIVVAGARSRGDPLSVLRLDPRDGAVLDELSRGGVLFRPQGIAVARPLPCANGLDDDGDGRSDFPDDPECTGIDAFSEDPACSDGIDNDLDGRVDGADPGCRGDADGSERDAALACDDGLDNDGDGFADRVDDPGCAAPDDASERDPSVACDDGTDDDGDGLIDFPADPGCTSPEDGSERGATTCDNGLDDDGDGLVDFPADRGCQSPLSGIENPACDNDVDDDNDGGFDWDGVPAAGRPRDPGCLSGHQRSEKRAALVCDNGEDDDGDGLIDFPADPGCASPADPAEGSACGEGPDADGDGTPDACDTCPAWPDPLQADQDEDGIGDACECGDATADGRVNSIDARILQRCAVGAFPCSGLCDANGDGRCNTSDARIIQRLAVGDLTKADLRCAQRP